MSLPPPHDPDADADARAGSRALPARTSAKAAADTPEVLARVTGALDLVDVIAKQLRRQLGGKVMVDELVSFGREGLLAAARTFDPTLGVPFRRWANYRVRGAMFDGVRSTSMLPRSVYERLRAIEGGHHAAKPRPRKAPRSARRPQRRPTLGSAATSRASRPRWRSGSWPHRPTA